MRRANLFWGAALIVAGLLFLLNTLGILTINVWGLIWPAILILAGLSVLWGALGRQRPAESQQASIPLDGASAAEVRVSFGAGRLQVGDLGNPAQIVGGTFEGGLDYKTDRDGETLKVKLRLPHEDWFMFPWMWGGERRPHPGQNQRRGGLGQDPRPGRGGGSHPVSGRRGLVRRRSGPLPAGGGLPPIARLRHGRQQGRPAHRGRGWIRRSALKGRGWGETSL